MKIKAEKRWSCAGNICIPSRLSAYIPRPKPVAVLPADAASVRAMVEQMSEAMVKEDFDDAHTTLSRLDSWRADSYRDQARAALAAIGIKGGSR